MNNSPLRLVLPPNTACEQKAKPPAPSADSDRNIILPLIILLLADRSDFFMVMTLLYIIM